MFHSLLEKRIAITIGFFVGVAGLIIGAVIVPTVLQIKQIDQDTYKLRLTLERKNEQVTSYRLAMKQMEKLKSEMPDFDSHLFVTGDELKLITSLENLAGQYGINQKITNSSIDNIANQKIRITMNITGQYHKVLTYLDELEHFPYFINITHLSISPFTDKSNPTATDNVVVNFDFNLYVIP